MIKLVEIKAYEIFKNKFGEKEAESIFEYFVSAKADTVTPKQVDNRLKDFKNIFATKEDLVREIGNTKSEIIKWMFIFWVGQLAAMFAFVKFLK